MDFSLQLDIPHLEPTITYRDKILLTGSCFTEHIADRLQQHKFDTCSNPHGILFNPISVAHSLDTYLAGKLYQKDDLFRLNELWNSWDHHTRFSDISADETLRKINTAQEEASSFIQQAGFVVITLGSAFQYYLKENGKAVANNHRAPGQWFEKRLLGTSEIVEALSRTLKALQNKNPQVTILFTISPVRHIRDGVVDNNRSKARLIDAVHTLCAAFSHTYYFPAYELVIDILRDYRFYDIDFVHPNYMATSYVWERFTEACMDKNTLLLMKEVQDITTARAHRPRFPGTVAHKEFKERYYEKIKGLLQQHPYLDLAEESEYFKAIE